MKDFKFFWIYIIRGDETIENANKHFCRLKEDFIMKALTDYKNLTAAQKEMIAQAQEELLIDEIMPSRVSELQHKKLVSALRHLRDELNDNTPKIIFDTKIQLLMHSIIPYKEWRDKRIKGEGVGIIEENLSGTQKEILEKADEINTFCFNPPYCNLTEYSFLLDAIDEYSFWRGEPFSYTDEFIDELIQKIGFYTDVLINNIA